MIKWYYANGPERVGPVDDTEWERLIREGIITPSTLVWNRDLPNWVAFRDLPAAEPEPEEEEEEAQPLPAPPVMDETWPERIAAQDYEVHRPSLFGETRALLRQHFWRLLGTTSLVFFIKLIFASVPFPPLLGYCLSLLLESGLFAGLLLFYFLVVREGEATSLELLNGFRQPVWSRTVFITICLHLVVFFSFFVVGLLVELSGVAKIAELQEVWTTLPVETQGILAFAFCVGLLPILYFAFCWMLAIPLVVDRHLPVRAALRLSTAKVLQHPWKILRLLLRPLLWLLPGLVAIGAITALLPVLGPIIPLLSILLVLSVGVYALTLLILLYEAIFNQRPVDRENDLL